MSGPDAGPRAQALFAALAEAPAAFARGVAAADAVELSFPGEAIRNVAVCGVGAEGALGDLLLGACHERMLVPVSVHSGYALPGWVGPDTLVVLLSASGTDEETLTCALLATERAALCVAVSGGGKLAGSYADEGVPVVGVPGDGEAGAAFYEMLGALVGLLDRLGVLPLQDGELDEAQRTLAAAVGACAREADPEANPARQLAAALCDTVPLVWGGELTGPVARRWVAGIRRHAKQPAWASELPQLDHDELMAFDGMSAQLAASARLVLLRDARQQRQVQRRIEHSAAVVADRVAQQFTVSADGRGPLARLLDLTVLGDHLALYLAGLRGVDAGEGERARRLNERLATMGMGRTASA